MHSYIHATYIHMHTHTHTYIYIPVCHTIYCTLLPCLGLVRCRYIHVGSRTADFFKQNLTTTKPTVTLSSTKYFERDTWYASYHPLCACFEFPRFLLFLCCTHFVSKQLPVCRHSCSLAGWLQIARMEARNKPN